MTDTEMQARDLALRERQLDLEERKLEANKTGVVDWLQSLGLPIASLVASIAVFVVQAQQQGFERTLNSVRDGYRMYFDSVAQIDLKTVDDFYKAKRVLETTSKIYPEVFCGARNDLVTRIMSASMNVDRASLIVEINSLPAPDPSSGITQPKWVELAWLQPSVPKCPVLTATNATAETPVAPTTPLAPAASDVAADANPEARAAAPAAGASAAAPGTVALAPETPQGPVLRRPYRVFVQVGPSRASESMDDMRDEAAALGFRLSAAEQMRRPILRGEVRYFGDDQAADAEALAKFMTEHFASEGLTFRPNAIGKAFPNLPTDTMEVWVPDSATAAATGAVNQALQRLPLRPRAGTSTTPSVTPSP